MVINHADLMGQPQPLLNIWYYLHSGCLMAWLHDWLLRWLVEICPDTVFSCDNVRMFEDGSRYKGYTPTVTCNWGIKLSDTGYQTPPENEA